MIPLHTPPGTKIVCINAADCEGYLYEGETYTLREWTLDSESRAGITLEEVDVAPPRTGLPIGYRHDRFRLAVLPKCLTDLLIVEMV